MSMRTSIATVCLSGTLPDKLAAAAHAGFDGVELFEPDLLGSPLSPAQVRELCTELGLSIDLYQPFRDVEGAPAERFRTTLRRARRVFTTMNQLGCDTVLICSSVAEDTIDDDALAASQLRQLAELADQHGIRLCYEALAWGIHVNTWEHSWRIVQQADHPRVGLCLDSFHVLSRTPEISGIAQLPGEKIFYLQLADAPHLEMDVLQWSRHHRLFPGQGSFDLAAFTAAVLEAGYSGPLSLEVFNDVFRQSPPALTALDAHRSLIDLTWRISDAPEALPQTPEPGACAFVELEATPSSALGLRTVLRALGFVQTATHRSKPVQLWEQGEARLLINTSAPSDSAGLRTRIAAVGLETEDPGEAAARAHALRADVLPRVIESEETAMPAVLSPDGTGLFFSPPEGGRAGQCWREDFTPGSQEVDAVDGPVTSIDHVSLTQPFDRFDEAILLFRSLLGLPEPRNREHAGPFGLVRSQEFCPEAGLGFVLNASVLRRGSWSPGVLSPQHIALATADAFAAADALAQADAPVLEISSNYYDDLAARLDLDEDFRTALQSRGLLYERDAQGGECLHLFTPVIGSQVFFEIVEHRGGFTGFGTADTPIRMASHAAQRSPLIQP